VFTTNLTKRFQLRNAFFSRRNRDQYLDAETMSYNPATDLLTRGELYFQHNRRPWQNQTDLLGDVGLRGTRHRFMAGYDYGDHDTGRWQGARADAIARFRDRSQALR
jgi:hypothetical protein